MNKRQKHIILVVLSLNRSVTHINTHKVHSNLFLWFLCQVENGEWSMFTIGNTLAVPSRVIQLNANHLKRQLCNVWNGKLNASLGFSWHTRIDNECDYFNRRYVETFIFLYINGIFGLLNWQWVLCGHKSAFKYNWWNSFDAINDCI